MMNRSRSGFLVAGLAISAMGLGLVGCSGEAEEEAPVVVRTPPPPPPPAAPTVTSIEDLMAEMRIDERVKLDESDAPDNDPDRRAVLSFFDAFVRGDSTSLGSMLSLSDRLELDGFSSTDSWEDTIEDIEAVEVQCGSNTLGQACVLAIFAVGIDFQPQLWYYDSAGDNYTFEAAPTPPDMMNRLHGDDWIAQWHDIIAAEIAKANELEEDVERTQRVLGETNDVPNNPGFNEGPGTAPNPGSPNPGRPPGRRNVPNQPRRPPGPGG